MNNQYYHYLDSWWEHMESPSQDEACVIEFLRELNIPDLRILHVGVGGNHIVKSIPAKQVTGLTNCIGEYQTALTLKLPNYKPILIDKHDLNLDSVLEQYDLIVDVNIRSYSPTLDDAARYLSTALNHLEDGGLLVTHRSGVEYRNPLNLYDLYYYGINLVGEEYENGLITLRKHLD